MRILAINPNSTPSMTAAIASGIDRCLGSNGACIGVTNDGAPAAIQGPEDGSLAVPGVLRAIREQAADGYVIACFDDTGLDEARSIALGPTIGIGQAAYHVARLLRPRFAVVTTLAVSVPIIEENIERMGFGPLCAGVRASGVPVLALESDPEEALEKISSQIAQIEETETDCAIVLGCAGMGILKDDLAARHHSLILDPVVCAGSLLPALVTIAARGRA